MSRDQIRRHLKLEQLMGTDALPAARVRGKAGSRAPASPRPGRGAPPPGPADPAPVAPEPAPPPSVPWFGEWKEFESKVLECRKCRLCEGRTQVVFGVGSLTSPVFFVGEGPGQQEDEQGEPFVGRAGQLLTRTLAKLGVKRAQVYISNIVKCRPPQNRTPQHDEVVACMPYLLRQIRHIRPKLVCALGGPSAQALLNTREGITRLRGRMHRYNEMNVFPTFHPAYVLRNMNNLGVLETDLSKVLREVGLMKS